MAITREKKADFLEKYAESLNKANALFLTQYQGISVNQMNALRKKLKDVDSTYVVVKNTLAKKALAEAGWPQADDLLEGPVGISFCFGEPPAVAKALVEFNKVANQLEIKGGLLGKSVLNSENVKSLADLPPIEVLRAQLLGIISAPATQLAGVVAGGVRQVINVVNAYAESGENENAEPVAA